MPTLTGIQKAAFTDVFDVWEPPALARTSTSATRITGGAAYTKIATGVKGHQQVRPNINENSRIGRMDEKTLITADSLFVHEDELIEEGYFLQRNQAAHPNNKQWLVVQGLSQNFTWNKVKTKSFLVVRADAPPGAL